MVDQEAIYLHVSTHDAVCRRVVAAGGCDRCALRRTAPCWSFYEAAPDVLRGALASVGIDEAPAPCRLCLGALAPATADAVAAAAAAHAGLAPPRDWKLNVSAPAAWLIRDAALGPATHGVKDAIKWVLSGDLARLAPAPAAGVAPDAACSFDVAFDCLDQGGEPNRTGAFKVQRGAGVLLKSPD